jgi:hypothetical protein
LLYSSCFLGVRVRSFRGDGQQGVHFPRSRHHQRHRGARWRSNSNPGGITGSQGLNIKHTYALVSGCHGTLILWHKLVATWVPDGRWNCANSPIGPWSHTGTRAGPNGAILGQTHASSRGLLYLSNSVFPLGNCLFTSADALLYRAP